MLIFCCSSSLNCPAARSSRLARHHRCGHGHECCHKKGGGGTKTGGELVTASNGTNSCRPYFRYNCARMNYFHHDGAALFGLSLKKVWKIESPAPNNVSILLNPIMNQSRASQADQRTCFWKCVKRACCRQMSTFFLL